MGTHFIGPKLNLSICLFYKIQFFFHQLFTLQNQTVRPPIKQEILSVIFITD